MKNCFVIIITGNDMGKISNQYYEMPVSNGSDHGFVLEQFMLEQEIDYPFWDYCFAHDAVKLAVLGNIVILTGNVFHIIALPDEISSYQRDELREIECLFNNEQSCLSIMNIFRESDRIVYEGIDSSASKKLYFELIEKKYQIWKQKSKTLNK